MTVSRQWWRMWNRMVRCCIWVRGSKRQAKVRQVTSSHPQITITLEYFLVAANLLHQHTRGKWDSPLPPWYPQTHPDLWLLTRHSTEMTIFTNILSCAHHGTHMTFSCHIWGGKFPVSAHVHPVNGDEFRPRLGLDKSWGQALGPCKPVVQA